MKGENDKQGVAVKTTSALPDVLKVSLNNYVQPHIIVIILYLAVSLQRFRNTVNLLDRLSPNHAHPSLIVNLYPDEQGYSLVLSPKKGWEDGKSLSLSVCDL